MAEEQKRKRRIGIVGFGKLGQFLYQKVVEEESSSQFEVVFVWNRSRDKLLDIPSHLILEDLSQFATKTPDLIVEVAHPCINAQYGEQFTRYCDYFVGSPTSFADKVVEERIRKGNRESGKGVYIPAGALWGAHDLAKMAERGSLFSLEITMKKHPSAFKILGVLKERLDQYVKEEEEEGEGREGEERGGEERKNKECVLYEGSVRDLCPLAPNNVNTMACAAIAANVPHLGFDGVVGRLVADKSLSAHVITINAQGPTPDDGSPPFSVFTTRYNPAGAGQVTGSATYLSFFSSLLKAHGHGPGFHFC